MVEKPSRIQVFFKTRMHPIFFKIGPFTLTSFGVMAACGYLSAILFCCITKKYRGLNADHIADLTFVSMVSGIIGARLFYVVQFWNQFKYNLIKIIRVDEGGLVFYGGFIFALLGIFIYCHKKKLSVLGVFDACAPCLSIGHAFGRIGCFLNGCCFGRPCNLPWGVEFPNDSMPFRAYPFQKIHPVQLYESIFNLFLAVLLFLLLKRKKNEGIVTGAYLVSYSSARFILEFLRGDHAYYHSGLTVSQIICILIFISGIYVLRCSFKIAQGQAIK